VKEAWLEVMRELWEVVPFVVSVLLLIVGVVAAGSFIVAVLGTWALVVAVPLCLVAFVCGLAFCLAYWTEKYP
jgi:uncharacterized membrane protein YoaK (UPF0700 family)